MSSTPRYADLSSFLYNPNLQMAVSSSAATAGGSAATAEETPAVLGAPSLGTNTTRVLQRQLLALEDPRAALLMGVPSLNPFEEELARRAQTANVLRRYNELKALEAASAAAGLNVGAATTVTDILRTNLAPAGSSSSSSPKFGPARATLSPTMLSVEPNLQIGAFAQQGIARPYSAFERVSAHGGILDTPLPNAPTKTEATGSKMAAAAHEDEEAFFKCSKGSKERFPAKLYRMIYEMEKEGRSDVVSFLPHGKAFAIHDEEAFVRDVMPRYFANCQLSSLQKQLNLYGFHKITVGKDRGKLRYFHASFLKGKPSLTDKIQRRRTSAAAKRKQQSM